MKHIKKDEILKAVERYTAIENELVNKNIVLNDEEHKVFKSNKDAALRSAIFTDVRYNLGAMIQTGIINTRQELIDKGYEMAEHLVKEYNLEFANLLKTALIDQLTLIWYEQERYKEMLIKQQEKLKQNGGNNGAPNN